jgi:hypothetical protein
MIARLICRLFDHPPAMSSYEEGAFGPILQDCPRCGAQHKVHNPRSLLLRRVHQGYVIPRGYGIAWVRFCSDSAVCMPVPLNLIAGALRRAWFWLKAPRFLYQDPRAAYFTGRRHGYDEAVRDGNQ